MTVRRTNHALPAEPVDSLSAHVERGGLVGLAWARSTGPAATIQRIEEAGIRGRGGAGFPTGRKWAGLRQAVAEAGEGYVVVNGAEGEPGTFKDRAILRADPYLVLEGAIIAARTVGVDRIVVATKARYEPEVAAIHRAAAELATAGQADGLTIDVVLGPDHYLFGEETALLEVIEGEDPLPRHLPPYLYGLFTTSPQLGWSAGVDASRSGPGRPSDNPALVNNVETYAHAALVCRHGPDWYRELGTSETPGPTVVTITGDVQRPVVAEIELGVSLGAVIEELAGGARPGRTIKAVLSGVSNPVLTAAGLGAPTSHEGLTAAGGGLGSAGFVVYDDSRNLVDVAYQVARFLHVESCGQCTPCKSGTGDIGVALEGLVLGHGDPGRHLVTIDRRLRTVTDAARCYLPVQARNVVASVIEHFGDDVTERLSGVPGDPGVPLPKLLDLTVDGVLIDADHHRKRPDWTYAETPVLLGRP